MLDIYSPSELTLVEHIERIQKSFETLRQSLFTTIVSIKECREQLGDEVFQKDVSVLLGMSPSYLNKWISIGNSDFIMNNQDRLPHTFSSLYSMTQLEKKYVDHYGPTEGIQKLEGHVDRGEVSLKSQQSEISNLIQNIEERIKRKQKRFREKFVLENLQNKLKPQFSNTHQNDGKKFQKLVKVYESMKPKEAAKIFNDLQIGVLVEMTLNMKESRLAAILSEMKPEKARELTSILATQSDITEY